MSTLPLLAQWSWVGLLFAPLIVRWAVPASVRRRWLLMLFFPAFCAILGINLLTFARSFEVTQVLLASQADFVDAAIHSADRSHFDWQFARSIATSVGDLPIHVFAEDILDPFWLRLVGVHGLVVDPSFRYRLTRSEAAALARLPAKAFALLEGENWTRVTFHLIPPTAGAKACFVLKESENNYWIVPDTRTPWAKGST